MPEFYGIDYAVFSLTKVHFLCAESEHISRRGVLLKHRHRLWRLSRVELSIICNRHIDIFPLLSFSLWTINALLFPLLFSCPWFSGMLISLDRNSRTAPGVWHHCQIAMAVKLVTVHKKKKLPLNLRPIKGPHFFVPWIESFALRHLLDQVTDSDSVN